MSYIDLLESIDMPACILQVERKGKYYGDIFICEANQLYKDTMIGYHEGMIYSDLVPKDLKFENICYMSAIKKQKTHAYVETKAFGCWTDQTLIPLKDKDTDYGYCMFVFKFTKGVDASTMADVSVDNARLCISYCVKLRKAEDFQVGMDNVMFDLMQYTEAFSSVIIKVDDDKKCVKLLGCACKNPKITSEIIEASLKYEIARTWKNTLGVSNAIIVRNNFEFESLKDRNELWYNDIKSVGVVSLCLVPLIWANNIVGYLYVTDYNVTRSDDIKELLELISFFIASEIYSHESTLELKKLSIIDSLTDCYNRNALIHRMTSDNSGNINVMYADINGLKDVNDNLGHEAGDKLIQDGAKILFSIFRNAEIYRSGGDEFVVISREPKIVFKNQVVQFRNKTSGIDNEVRFASGVCYGNDELNIGEVMKIADDNMYKDKERFYRITGLYNSRR